MNLLEFYIHVVDISSISCNNYRSQVDTRSNIPISAPTQIKKKVSSEKEEPKEIYSLGLIDKKRKHDQWYKCSGCGKKSLRQEKGQA